MPSQYVQFDSKKANPDNEGVFDIDPKELDAKKDQVAVIDVRRPDEYGGELGHVPGADLIVLDTLPDYEQDIPKDKTVVFVCRSGGRSGRAAAWAIEQGFTSVFNMKGGMLAWNEQGLEVEGRNEG